MPLVQALTFLYDTPGAGKVAPTRYSMMIPRVNRIFLRRSGVAKAERNALSTRDLLGGTGRAAAWPVSSWPAVAGGGLGLGTDQSRRASKGRGASGRL